MTKWMPKWIKRWFAMRRFKRCNGYGHEPFYMNDDGTWKCECGFSGGKWNNVPGSLTVTAERITPQ